MIYKLKHKETTHIEKCSKNEVKFMALDCIPHMYEKLKYILKKYTIILMARQ